MDSQMWITFKELIKLIWADKRLLIMTLTLLVSSIGAILAAITLVHTLCKDRRLKKMERLEKSPSFHFCNFQIYIRHKLDGYGKPIEYSYDNQECALSQSLVDIKTSIPDDYPDGGVVGMVIKNRGAALRFYKIRCKEECVLQPYNSEINCYEFRHRFKRSDIGKPFRFKLQFETEAGLKDTQTWLARKGSPTIQRIKPKSV
jgi:hypothetical protein